MAKRKKRGRFRSKSEEDVCNTLTDLGIPIRYEQEKIKYDWLEHKTYTPDFILDNGIIIETKGRFRKNDRMKHRWIKEQYPEIDIRFVFTNPNAKISKRAKSTCAQWCDKYGFLYNKGVIPDEWFNETKDIIT